MTYIIILSLCNQIIVLRCCSHVMSYMRNGRKCTSVIYEQNMCIRVPENGYHFAEIMWLCHSILQRHKLLTAKLIFVRLRLWDQNKCWNLPTKMGPARPGVYTVLLLMIHVLWDVTLRRQVHHYQCFEGSYCLHHQGSRIQEHPWRKSHNDPLKRGELLTQRHSVIPHNTWILNHLNHFSIEGDRGSDNNSHSTLI